jgi:flagellar biosynthesis/type III secretory pathway chaperone
MADVLSMATHLRAHLELCREILTVVERENAALRTGEPNAELAEAKKKILPALNDSLARLKEYRAEWTKVSPSEKEKHPEIAALLRENQDVIMRIIVLDRENEQTLLRQGMVPPKHLPAAERQRPHFVADLYRRGGQS